NGNGGTRYFQKFREKTDTDFVCSAVDGRSGNLQLECIPQHSRDSLSLCFRMNLHRKRDAICRLLDSDHRLSAPLAEDARAYADTRRALFNSDFEIVRHAHRE